MKEDILHVMEISDKKRLEIVDDKIRALYGHSIPMHIKKQEAEPPAILYHGTTKRFLSEIKEKGLLPMIRQYVHLSVDTETAMQVAKKVIFQQVFAIKCKNLLKIDIFCNYTFPGKTNSRFSFAVSTSFIIVLISVGALSVSLNDGKNLVMWSGIFLLH